MNRLNNKKSTFVLAAIAVIAFGTYATGQGRVARDGIDAGGVHNHYYGNHFYGGGYGGYGLPGYYGGGYGGMTAAAGAGYGVGQAAQGIGQERVDTAQSAQIYSQTAHQSIENHNFAVNSYYANKDAHDKYMAEHQEKAITQEEANKIEKENEPGRLSTAQFDADNSLIHWPPILRDKAFTKSRQKLDHLFHERTPGNSGVDSDSYGEIKAACDEMHNTLRGMIGKLQPMTYIAAEHFIKSLAYEGEFPPKK